MSFMESLKETLNEDMNVSVTENGAIGYRTSGKNLLDINFAVSSLRNKNDIEVRKMFEKAFYENKLLSIKWAFFARDVRGGLGERRLFRIALKFLENQHPEIAKAVIALVPEYGRWDDLWEMLETPLKDDVVTIVQNQLTLDMDNMLNNKPISLIGKWLPSENTSSAKTKRLAKIMRTSLELTPRQYRKMLSKLRKYLRVVETYMSSKEWGAIEYSQVPSRANLIYNAAFLRNDEERRREYLGKLEKGETKINSSVLFPHDIVHKYSERSGWYSSVKSTDDIALEQMWKALPDYVKDAGNTICVADGSGSMTVKVGGTQISALEVANALAIYFAERSSGQFKDNYITFSERPQLVDLSKGKSLREKIAIALTHSEVANTNIEAVFNLILQTAINKKMTQEELPQNILILSDMEFDSAQGYRRGIDGRLFKVIADRYAEHGYKLPRLVFWNINGRTGTIPVKENKLGVALVSGFSPAITKMVLSNKTDPFECLVEQLNAERYDAVETAIKELI